MSLDEDLGSTVITLLQQPHASTADGPTRLRLIVLGSQSFATHTLPDRGALSIGRSTACDLVIDDRSISRRHAMLAITDRADRADRITIEDLGSSNGTRVRGQQLAPGERATIALGELVALGDVNLVLQREPAEHARRTLDRDQFAERITEECARTVRSGRMFGLLQILPEQRGHARLVEEVLARALRDTDLLGRRNAFELAVLLTDTTPAQAEIARARLERKLAQIGLQCVFLIACCPADGTTPDALDAKLRPPPATAAPAAPRVDGEPHIIIVDRQMQSLHRMVAQIAPSQLSILLLGETGVGKEVFARAVHRASLRASGPLVELNCAALPEGLLESELFGHEKGAFTHASGAKVGLIETAHQGTLFLDEIGDMPLTTQAKMLRFLEDAQLRRVGSVKSRTVDVRIVAATNVDLEARIAAGTFRGDLFFRLNGFTLVIPPLRERLDELVPLTEAFMRRNRPTGPLPRLAPTTLAIMRAYHWPGNVRELRYMIERAVLLCQGDEILPEHLPQKLQTLAFLGEPAPDEPLAEPADDEPVAPPTVDEERRIVEALDRAGGNQTLAARLLGVSRRTLVNRLNAYKHIERPRKHKKASPD